MSTATEVTHQAMAGEARSILAGVTAAPWPGTREAQKAVGYLAARAAECRDEYDRLLSEETDPMTVPAPDRGWWTEPLPSALEWAADQALEAAKAARNRLAEYARRENEAARTGSDGGAAAIPAGAKGEAA
jgi:hypothetical protein